MKNEDGYSLVELLIVLALIALFILASIPAFASFQRKSAVRAASASMRSIFQLARSRAIARGANCGVKFTRANDEWQFALYDDGDGDGVRNDDINRGVDKRATRSRIVFPESKIVSIGLLEDAIVDPDGDAMTPDSSPVQFNRSTICSFSPLGGATPGTIYLTTDRRDLWAVRVYGATGKMTVLRYDAKSETWRR